MNARSAALRVLASAMLLSAFACGDARCGGKSERAGAAAADAPPETGAAPAGSEPLAFPSEDAGSAQPAGAEDAAPRERSEAEERIATVLDTDPEGAGLDALMRTAREDADASVREAAVIALGDSEDDRAIDALIAASEDHDARVVLAAIDQLSWSDDRQAQAALQRLARSANAEIAAAAEEALAD